MIVFQAEILEKSSELKFIQYESSAVQTKHSHLLYFLLHCNDRFGKEEAEHVSVINMKKTKSLQHLKKLRTSN